MPSQPKRLLTPALAAFLALTLGATLLLVPAASPVQAERAESAQDALDGLVQRGQLSREDADTLAALAAKTDGGFTPQERDGLQAVLDRLGAAVPASAPLVVPDLPDGPTLTADAPCSQCMVRFVTCVVNCIAQFVDCVVSTPQLLLCLTQLLECLNGCIASFLACVSSCTPPLADVTRQAGLLQGVARAA